MDIIAMGMSGCDTEQDARMTEMYGEEVMYAGWNPQLSLVSDNPVVQSNKQISLPSDLASVDVDAFLRKMYEHLC